MKPALIALALLLPTVAFAQFNLGTTEPLVLAVSPQYPRPGSSIMITPQSGKVDLAASTMTISVNSKQVYAGNAVATPVTIGAVGQTTTIVVRVTSRGATYSKTLTLRPGDVSLVAEPIASAPVLYEGKPLTPQSGSVRLVAVADFRTSPSTRLDPDTLSYTWIVGGTTFSRQSGLGRNSIIVPSPLAYRNETITVVVKSSGGSVVSGDSITLSPQSPTLRIYEQDPLQGVLYDHALSGTYAFGGSEATFVAVPYSAPLTGGAPTIQWFLGGVAAQTGPAITLRPEGAGRGRASLSATATAGVERALAALSLTYGNEGNFFGL